MKAICSDCGTVGKGKKDELIALGWLGVQTWIQMGSKKAYIKFELCPDHAKVVSGGGLSRFMEVLTEKAKQQGIHLNKLKEAKPAKSPTGVSLARFL